MYPIHLNFLRHSTSSNENKYVIEVHITLETKNYCGGISEPFAVTSSIKIAGMHIFMYLWMLNFPTVGTLFLSLE